jgi:hypothetical protein
VRKLAPALRTSGYSVEFERAPHTRQRIIRLTFLDYEGPAAKVLDGDPDKTDAAVEQIATVMVAGGLDETWEPVRAATRARDEASGDSFLAAQALNLLKIPAPDGGAWTAWKVHGVT